MVPIQARAAVVVAALLATTTAPAAAATSPSAAAEPVRCRTSNLALDWTSGGSAEPGGRHTEGRQVDVFVSMRNTGSHVCVLRGHPAVTLQMGTETEGVVTETFSPLTSQQPTTVRLAPGATARFTMTFLSVKESDDNVIDPGVAVITPPGNNRAKQLRWWWGPVQQQEAATHPGNYVSPVFR